MKDLLQSLAVGIFVFFLFGVIVYCLFGAPIYEDKMIDGETEEVFVVEEREKSIDVIGLLDFVHEMGKEDVSVESALRLLDTLGVEHKVVVVAQMRLESGNFKSVLAEKCNNFFGMKHPTTRVNVSCGRSESGYATYKNWAWSVLDYALWQRRYASGLSESEYLSFLGKRYAEDERYIHKVQEIADSLKTNFNN